MKLMNLIQRIKPMQRIKSIKPVKRRKPTRTFKKVKQEDQMKTKPIIALVIITVSLAIMVTLLKSAHQHQLTDTAFGETVTIRARGWGVGGRVRAAMERIHEIEARMSLESPTSDITRINRGEPYWGNPDTIRVANRGIFFGDFSDGLFDISINPILELYERVPSPSAAAITAARNVVDYRRLEVHRSLPQGMSLNINALAKGYAADEAALLLRRSGVRNLQIDMGNVVVAFGQPYWPIRLLEHAHRLEIPPNTVGGRNAGIASFGLEREGSHRFDPRTGMVVSNNVVNATAIASSGMDAVALAQFLFVADVEGLASLDELQAHGIIITRDHRIVATRDINIRVTNPAYRYEGERR